MAMAHREADSVSWTQKYRWKLLYALLVIVVVSALFVRWWLGERVIVETLVRRDFAQSVVASGHVETPHRVDIGAGITGTVARVPVAEGQTVQAGTVLIELESAELRAVERLAQVAVTQAQGRLRQLREVQAPVAEQAQRQAKVNLDNAQSILRRNQELFQKNFIAESVLEDSRKAVELADAQVRLTQKQVETARPAGSDYALAQAAVAEAQANVDAAHARARYAVIRAPVEGILIGRNVEVGDVVQAGKVLMTLSPAGRTQIVVNIDEKNLRLLSLGQKAWVSADAYPKQRFLAELLYINPGVNAQTGAVEVKLDVPEPPQFLRQDMTVSVDIEVARRPNALLVPIGVVHDIDSSTPWLWRLEDGRAVRRPIQLGLRSAGFAEVLDGLSSTDLVIPASAGIATGARVRTTQSAN